MKKEKPLAVTLCYDSTGVPRVSTRGTSSITKQIIAAAKEYGIPIEQNEELTALLSTVKLHDEIPPKLYAVVAQLLVFIYHINEQKRQDQPDE